MDGESPQTGSFYEDKRTIRDGRVLLYKRRGNDRGIWQRRVKLIGATGYVTRSTKTPVYEKAVEYAAALFDDLRQRVKDKRPIKKHTFVDVYELWLKSLHVTKERFDYHKKTGGRYFRCLTSASKGHIAVFSQGRISGSS